MQTAFSKGFLATATGKQADKILRACVHCGFCTATCPTYLLTSNELDSPRGRIYLIKEMLEGAEVSRLTQTHLDRCLSCQSCETTCPSNVNYHELLSIGRDHIDKLLPRSRWQQYKRKLLRRFLLSSTLFNPLLMLGRLFKFCLPSKLRRSIATYQHPGQWPQLHSKRKMLVLNGCVQKQLSPNTNSATARVLAKFDIQLIHLNGEGCCGALDYHMDAHGAGRAKARHNIDLICQQLDQQQGVEAIISTASGCGNFIKQYAEILRDDSDYIAKAKRVVEHCKDLSEILLQEDLAKIKINATETLAFHCPCTLQHGQQLSGAVESLLIDLGFTLSPVEDSHICCGSAGTYSILQPEFSKQLQANKISALAAGKPDAIVTANIGCQTHLSAVSKQPVQHWIEYVDAALIKKDKEHGKEQGNEQGKEASKAPGEVLQ